MVVKDAYKVASKVVVSGGIIFPAPSVLSEVEETINSIHLVTFPTDSENSKVVMPDVVYQMLTPKTIDKIPIALPSDVKEIVVKDPAIVFIRLWRCLIFVYLLGVVKTLQT